MTKEKIPIELLEIIVQMAHDEEHWNRSGLLTCQNCNLIDSA